MQATHAPARMAAAITMPAIPPFDSPPDPPPLPSVAPSLPAGGTGTGLLLSDGDGISTVRRARSSLMPSRVMDVAPDDARDGRYPAAASALANAGRGAAVADKPVVPVAEGVGVTLPPPAAEEGAMMTPVGPQASMSATCSALSRNRCAAAGFDAGTNVCASVGSGIASAALPSGEGSAMVGTDVGSSVGAATVRMRVISQPTNVPTAVGVALLDAVLLADSCCCCRLRSSWPVMTSAPTRRLRSPRSSDDRREGASSAEVDAPSTSSPSRRRLLACGSHCRSGPLSW